MESARWQTDFMNEYETDKETIDSFVSELDAYSEAVSQVSTEAEARKLAGIINAVLAIPKKWGRKNYMNFRAILREKAADVYGLKSSLEQKLMAFEKTKKKNHAARKAKKILEEIKTVEDVVEEGPADEEDEIEAEESDNQEETEEKQQGAKKEKTYTPKIQIVKPSIKGIEEVFDRPERNRDKIVYANFTDVVDYSESVGIVGEKDLSILMPLCVIGGESFGIEGDSGSGKSFITDPFIALFDPDMVCVLGLMSDTVIFRMKDRINGSWIKYAPELQKVITRKNNPTVEYIKNFCEGKKTVRTISKPGGEGVIEYELNADGIIIYTLAIENSFKKDKELGRRVIVLYTDDSEEHQNEVENYQAELRCGDSELPSFSKARLSALKRTIINAMALEEGVNNPFSYFTKEFTPKKVPKAMSFNKHVYALENACCKFHYGSRISDGSKLFMTIFDEYITNQLYLPHYYRSLAELCSSDEQRERISEKMEKKPDWQKCWDFGVAKMREKYAQIAEKWIQDQVKDGVVSVYDPIKQQEIELARHAA